ncbi:MAG: hypothetical protein H0W65_02065 [Sphingomonas sp.]|uniref:hypothetical protein n=1 Tax=Sphingomonas sp. TaxID=28214 RepID=UPI001845F0FC|nr:hypothetical protein [Sphingomonas sp.]MBA3666494.1 hypothetical protein [Sphingomonas sp.]
MSNLSIGQAWDQTSAFLRAEARLVVPVALAAFAVPSTLAGWTHPAGEMSGSGPGVLLTLLVLVAVLIGQMTIAALAIGSKDSVGSLIGRAARRVWGPVAAVIMVFLPVALLMLLMLSAIVGAAGITDPSKMTPEAMASSPQIGLILLCMLVLILLVGVRLLPMSAVAIEETPRPVALLRRCLALTKGHFWRLLGLLMLMVLAALLLSGAVTAVVGAVVTLAVGEARPFNLSALLIGLANGLSSAAITAVSAALVGRVYVQLNAKS